MATECFVQLKYKPGIGLEDSVPHLIAVHHKVEQVFNELLVFVLYSGSTCTSLCGVIYSLQVGDVDNLMSNLAPLVKIHKETSQTINGFRKLILHNLIPIHHHFDIVDCDVY